MQQNNLTKRYIQLTLILICLAGLLLAACGETAGTGQTGFATPATVPATVTVSLPSDPTAAVTVSLPSDPAPTATLPLPFPTPEAATAVPPTPLTVLSGPTVTAPIPTVPPTNSAARQPAQPRNGPGGAEYAYSSVKNTAYGSGAERYFIFEPEAPRPTRPLPVVVFLHGYGGVNPFGGYFSWITHLAKRGNIVIFPAYQLAGDRDGEKFTDNAAAGIKNALQKLQTGPHARPDLDRYTMAGYSAGGVIAVNLAARVAKYGLPLPRAIFPVTPGGCANCSVIAIRNFQLASAAEIAAIPPETRLVVLVGEKDNVVGETASSLIWQNTAHLPAASRSYLMAVSDNHGQPVLYADHGMATRTPPDAYNYFGIWKLFDGLQACAHSGKDCEYALGGSPQQRGLGKWSDGVPVAELKVLG